LAQTLDTLRFRDPPRLVLVTRQAQAVHPGEGVAPEQALLWGLGGTLRSECSGLRVLRIDLPDAVHQTASGGRAPGTAQQPRPADEDCAVSALLVQLLASGDDEDQVAVRAGQRFVARLRRAQREWEAKTAQPAAVRSDGTYLVTGGMSGLGLSAAGWLAERGAGHLLLIGRHIRDDAAALQRLAALEAFGARVTLCACDVSDGESLRAALAEHTSDVMPLRGVIHAAGALADSLIARQSFESFQHVFAAKVGGAWLLHLLTAGLPLDFFVLYSSAASLMGSAGQANYVAANAFLDALAHHRHALGLPAKSINWGHFVDIGHVADKQFRGLRGLREHEGQRLLAAALTHSSPQLGAIALDASELLDFYPHLARWPYLQELANEQRTQSLGDPELLARLHAGDLVQNMREYLRAELARVVRIAPARIEDEAPLSRLGLDSLMGLELRRRLEATLGITLPATLVWTYPTLHAVADFLSEQIAVTAPLEQSAEARESQLSELSDQQLWELTKSLVS
jgi:NAD(P)-dependent dehydrogenase (short-subunit alcohol dehydrogenase family)/acyl carrier protein